MNNDQILECKICGFKSTNLTTHIPKKHNISNKEYKKKYNVKTTILFSEEAINKIKASAIANASKNVSPFSITYWTNKGYTEEEAKYQISIRRPNNILYWINKGYAEEEAKIKLTEFMRKNSISKKYLIKKYGKEEGLKRYNEIWNEDRKTIKNNTNIKYWINKGYTEEEARKKLIDRQATFSKKKLETKYNKDIANQKLKNRNEKWQRSLNENNDMSEINKRKDSASINYFKQKCKETWVVNYINKNYSQKNGKILITIYNNIKTQDDFYKNILNYISIDDLVFILKQKIIKNIFDLSSDVNSEFNKIILLSDKILPIIVKKTKWGDIIKFNNYVFRSKGEYEIGKFLLDNNIEFELEKWYPFTKKYKCDFYIKKYDYYIELTGMMKIAKYRNKMIDKRTLCELKNLKYFESSDPETIINFIKELYEN